MAGKKDENLYDQDDDAQTDPMEEAIGEAYDKLIASAEDDADDADDGGMDQPMDESAQEVRKVVDPSEGRALVDEAEVKGPARTKKEKAEDLPEDEQADAADDSAEEEIPETETKDEEAEAGEGTPAPDAAESEIDKLIADVPEASREAIRTRLTEADDVLAPFKARADQIKAANTTPRAVMERLLQINDYAGAQPDAYLAWVAKQFGEDKPEELLGKAAEKLGLKVVKAEEAAEGDPFDDDTTRELKAEVARLRAKVEGGRDLGPDSPEFQQRRQAQQDYAAFISATDADGTPKHKHLNQLEPVMATIGKAQIERTGEPLTGADLENLYAAAYQLEYGQPLPQSQPADSTAATDRNLAAKERGDMAKQLQDKAARASKAKRASKTLDGTGQGVSRRPALSPDANLEEVIEYNMQKYGF